MDVEVFDKCISSYDDVIIENTFSDINEDRILYIASIITIQKLRDMSAKSGADASAPKA